MDNLPNVDRSPSTSWIGCQKQTTVAMKLKSLVQDDQKSGSSFSEFTCLLRS